MTRRTGQLDTEEAARHLEEALSQAGFLEDEVFGAMSEGIRRAWLEQSTIPHSHSGPGNYPDDAAGIRRDFELWTGKASPGGSDPVRAVASPHASPGAVRSSYGAAYRALAGGLSVEDAAGKTFVILGTSHYGTPDRLGVTRKQFTTPLGAAVTDASLLAELEKHAAGGLIDEDRCFAREHSIEFQIVFLQYLYGPGVRILPLLCGTFAHGLMRGLAPESDEMVRRNLEALAAMNARHQEKLVWVLGVDMAHIGRRYHDDESVRAGGARMTEVESADRARIASIVSGDAAGFWDQVQVNRDPLKWCGSAPFYAYLRAVSGGPGRLLSYEQWQIDRESVVTAGALTLG